MNYDNQNSILTKTSKKLEALIYYIAENSYSEAATHFNLSEEDIYSLLKAHGFMTKPSAIQRAAENLKHGQTLEMAKKTPPRKFTDSDCDFIYQKYQCYGSINKTAHILGISHERIRQVLCSKGMTSTDIRLAGHYCQIVRNQKRIAIFIHNDLIMSFEGSYAAAQYLIDSSLSSQTNLKQLRREIRKLCKTQKTGFGYTWVFEDEAELFIRRNTIRTSESKERQTSCGIYIVLNDINDKVYIGKTRVSFIKRWQAHKIKSKQTNYNTTFYNAIRDIGFENFTFHILEIIDPAESNQVFLQRERYWINQYNAMDPEHGYNSKTPSESFLEQTETHDVLAIIIEILQGKAMSEIASKHNVSASLVSLIKQGKRNHIAGISYPILTPNEQYQIYYTPILIKLLTCTDLPYKSKYGRAI